MHAWRSLIGPASTECSSWLYPIAPKPGLEPGLRRAKNGAPRWRFTNNLRLATRRAEAVSSVAGVFGPFRG